MTCDAVFDTSNTVFDRMFKFCKILVLEQCGCFYCLKTMAPGEITEWVDGGETPVCPHCGVDAVLPGVVSKETLASLHKRAFSVEKVSPTAR